MKKIISMITCLIILTCMLVVPEPIEVHAEESDTESNRYYVEALTSYNSGSNLYRGYYVNFAFSIDKKICGYLDNSYEACIYLFLYDENGYTSLGRYVHNLKNYISYSLEPNGVYKYGDYEFNGGNFTFTGIISEKENTLHADLSWDSKNIEDSGFIKTNIPYFASQEECMSYIAGDLSVKNAVNYETDICDIKYDLEVPQNLKIKDVQNTGPEGYFNITWEQTDPDYVDWQTEIYNYIDFRYRDSFLIFSWADWKYVEDYYAGQSIIETYKLSYKHRHRENLDDRELHDKISAEYPTDYGGIYKLGDEKLYIRNYYYDGTYRHYSNWIVLEFDSEEDAWMNPEMNSTVVEKEGSELDVDDDGVPFQPDSNVVQDSEYTGGVNENYERVDGTDLISWIKNGFGLGGDNGVLGMMGESFSFIPGEIWAVFAAGISMMVVVAVFKFIRG